MLRFCTAILYFLFFYFGNAYSQCVTPVSNFPYRETFEATDGNWTAGGTASDWTWGTPRKPVINAAGEGTRCWVIGGLVNSSYNNGESSFLISPCFDFSTLTNPYISFKVFWETERRFDGAALQYSIDDGNNWVTIGSVNSNGNCAGVNWYNTPSVNFLGGSTGWSGNKQATNGSCLGGSGSDTWLNASHELAVLAGEPAVKFKFIFGAGTTCNAFDGFAVDDIAIFNAIPNTADFSFSCQTNKTVAFTNNTLCATSADWDFDDPASGTNNNSTLTNPSHTFSSPGEYAVTLTATFASGATSTITKQIIVLGVNAQQDQFILCHGDQTAAISALASGSPSGYNYSWNTTPVHTSPSLSNISAGTYIINVTAINACAASDTIIVVQPAALSANPAITDQRCTSGRGSIISNISGGTAPYRYSWSNGANTADLLNIPAGNYSLMVTDANGCVFNLSNLVVVSTNLACV